MNKSIVAAIIAVVIVLVGGGIYLGTRGNDNSSTQSSPTSTQGMDMSKMDQGKSSTSSQSAPAAASSVTIENFAFSPASITVKKGTTVTWTNRDSTAHTVTENDGQTGPDSGSMANGKSYSFTFNAVGTFKYHCAFHPEMLGTVTVTD